MSRLTKHGIFPKESVMFVDSENNYMPLVPCEMKAHHTQLVMEKLADYEDKEEQGLIFIAPCKVGDIVWNIQPAFDEFPYLPYPLEVTGFTICSNGIYMDCIYSEQKKEGAVIISEFGKTVFTSRSEALAKIGGK